MTDTVLIIAIGICGTLSLIFSGMLAANQNKQTEDLKNKTEAINNTSVDISEKADKISEATVKVKDLNVSILDHSQKTSDLTTKIQELISIENAKNATTGTLKGFELDAQSDVVIYNGSETFTYPQEALKTEKFPINALPMSFIIKDRRLLVSVTIRNWYGDVLFDMTENKWLSDKRVLSKNYDNRGIELMDNQKNIILSIDVKKANQVFVKGIFQDAGVIYFATDSGFTFLPIQQNVHFQREAIRWAKEIKPVFIHHGEGSFGKRIASR